MKKINFTEWRSPPPSLIFSGSKVSILNIEWPDFKGKNEYIDPLTETPNRRAYDEISQVVAKTANQQGQGLG